MSSSTKKNVRSGPDLVRLERDLGRELAACRQPEQVLPVLLKAACTLEGVAGGAVYRCEAGRSTWSLVEARGLPPDRALALARLGRAVPALKNIPDGQALYVTKAEALSLAWLLAGWQVRGLAVLPVRLKGKLAGVLQLTSVRARPPGALYRRALDLLVRQAGGRWAELEEARALRESEERFRAVCDAAAEGILVFGAEGGCVYANPVAREGLGAPGAGRRLEVPASWRTQVRETVASGQPSSMEESLLLHGAWREIESSWVPLAVDRPGRVLAVSCVYRDVTDRLRLATERRLLAKRLLEVQEQERKNISGFLHDHMGPLLIMAKIDLEQLARRVSEKHHPLVRQVAERLDESLRGIRHKALAVRPPLLDDLEVKEALEFLIEEYKSQHGIQVRLAPVPRVPSLTPAIKTCLYRVLEEALSNVVIHARATATEVLVERLDHALRMQIQDNGIGYDAASVQPGDALGLVGMREIVHSLGGSLSLQSRVGHGTLVRVVLPVHDEKEQNRDR